jgi:hypothetical protein
MHAQSAASATRGPKLEKACLARIANVARACGSTHGRARILGALDAARRELQAALGPLAPN